MSEVLFNSCYNVLFLAGQIPYEGADDAGGVFDETLTEMCEELEGGQVGCLIKFWINNSLEIIYYRKKSKLFQSNYTNIKYFDMCIQSCS